MINFDRCNVMINDWKIVAKLAEVAVSSLHHPHSNAPTFLSPVSHFWSCVLIPVVLAFLRPN